MMGHRAEPWSIFLAVGFLVFGCSDQGAAPDGGAPDAGAPADASADVGPPTDGGTLALVETASGPVQGEVGEGFIAFRGIPYAAPPVGELRWAPPQPPAAWTAVRDATSFGSYCPQLKLPHNGLETSASEDCLNLTVWVPDPLPTTPVPVMVWIHGGAFTDGGSSWAWTSGRHLAATMNTIVVAMNYRLGPLGFLGHAALGEGRGNFGLLDQQLALAWVQQHIGAFGGDPDNVTLFGHSAGGASVCAHLASPGSAGLFHRAIMQGSACGTNLATSTAAETQGALLAAKLGCDSAGDVAACLRGKSVDEVLHALSIAIWGTPGEAIWGPVVDGVSLLDQPLAVVRSGSFNQVPFIIGTNTNEGVTWFPPSTNLTAGEYEAGIYFSYGLDGDAVLAEYPVSAFATPSEAAAEVLGDAAFVCPARATARAVAAAGVTTRLYTFNHVPSFRKDPNRTVYHNAMLWMVFHTTLPPDFVRTPEETELSQTLMGYWTRFAATGDPNDPGEVAWPAYDETTDQHLTIDVTFASGSGHKQAKCDFWESLGYP